METIWKDLARDERQVKSLDWHFDELKARELRHHCPRRSKSLNRPLTRCAAAQRREGRPAETALAFVRSDICAVNALNLGGGEHGRREVIRFFASKPS